MMEAIERARQVAELGFAAGAIGARGYATTALESAVPELVVHLDDDGEGRPRALHLRFVSLAGGLAHTKLLQIWAALPFTVPPNRADAVRAATSIVTLHAAIGSFGIDGDGRVHYRYVLAAPAHELLDDDMLGEIVALADFHQHHFGDFVEGVSTGETEIASLDRLIASN